MSERLYYIEMEVMVTQADIDRIMGGDDPVLKARLFELLKSRTSSRKLGEDVRLKRLPANTLEGAEPSSNPNKHRGGGGPINRGAGLKAFFRLSPEARQKRGR